MKKKINKLKHANSLLAKSHGKDLQNTSTNMNLDKEHKDWYLRSELGKQRNKPRYFPPKKKKIKK